MNHDGGTLDGIAGVVFDFDGTLADTQGAIVATVLETLQQLGIEPLPVPTVVAHIGLPLAAVFRTAGADEAGANAAIAVYRERFVRHVDRVALFPGAAELLQALRDRGLPLGIASSRMRGSLLELVERLHLASLVDEVLGHEDAVQKKPAPDLVHAIAGRWSVPSERLLVVGDTTFDVAMGKAAGARVCAVTHGSHGAAELAGAGADALFGDLPSLTRHLLGQAAPPSKPAT